MGSRGSILWLERVKQFGFKISLTFNVLWSRCCVTVRNTKQNTNFIQLPIDYKHTELIVLCVDGQHTFLELMLACVLLHCTVHKHVLRANNNLPKPAGLKLFHVKDP